MATAARRVSRASPQRQRRDTSPQQLAQRVRELESVERESKRVQAKSERDKKKELADAKKRIQKEIQAATRVVQRGEKEASKIASMVRNVEQQAEQIKQSQTRQHAAFEKSVAKMKEKRGMLEADLLQKTSVIGEARGRLAHVTFAAKMLESGVIVPVDSVEGDGAATQVACEMAVKKGEESTPHVASEVSGDTCVGPPANTPSQPLNDDSQLADTADLQSDMSQTGRAHESDASSKLQSQITTCAKTESAEAGAPCKEEAHEKVGQVEQKTHGHLCAPSQMVAPVQASDSAMQTPADLRGQVNEAEKSVVDMLSRVRAVRHSEPAMRSQPPRSFSLQVPPRCSPKPSEAPVEGTRRKTSQCPTPIGPSVGADDELMSTSVLDRTSEISWEGLSDCNARARSKGSAVGTGPPSIVHSVASSAGVLMVPQGHQRSLDLRQASVPVGSICAGFRTSTPLGVRNACMPQPGVQNAMPCNPQLPAPRVRVLPPQATTPTSAIAQRQPPNTYGEVAKVMPPNGFSNRSTIHGMNYASRLSPSSPTLLMNMRSLTAPGHAVPNVKPSASVGALRIPAEPIRVPVEPIARQPLRTPIAHHN
eukprot:TRINITY_DN54260_c0_g1_i1.p1 TRINITY_DN54260_c0_g1~~TRINITY_DN54260_c0_g1_i1.p1  ORF type:complete len:614 (-),score=72.61 TRINITY_DN54260_c0_g1_i1:333-2114(-)